MLHDFGFEDKVEIIMCYKLPFREEKGNPSTSDSEIVNEQNKAGREKPPSDFRATFLDPLSLSNVIDFIDFYPRRRF